MKIEKYKLIIGDHIASVTSASLADRRALTAMPVFAAGGRVTFASRQAGLLSLTTGMNLDRGASMISPALLPHKKRAEHSAPAAFTLVEMLVAVGLVVLMMTLFAQIFQMATGTMQTQKGLSENDQRVRLVMNLLRNDLNSNPTDTNNNNQPRQYRTFRLLIPYGSGELDQPTDPVTGSPADNAGTRNGYFYVSEGNVFDDTDDVLAMTVAIPNASNERLYGKATLLFDSKQNSNWPNQPEYDDVLGVVNNAGSSTIAEVCYFLRAGTLYRRMLLVRKPNVPPPPPQDGTPSDSNSPPLPLNMSAYLGASGTTTFWNDFDYSAYYNQNQAIPLRFHSTGTVLDSLSANSAQPNPFSLSNPAYRFGFDSVHQTNPPSYYGLPREYISIGNANGNSSYFLGRFTQRETSDPNFGYPGSITRNAGNPTSYTTPLGYQSDSTLPNYGVALYGNSGTPFNGTRAGEDVLMTNVMKFDIKVWDPAASYGGDNSPGFAGVDDDNNGIVDFINNDPTRPDPAEIGWPGSDDGDFRDIGHHGNYGHYSLNSTQNGFSNLSSTLLAQQYGSAYYQAYGVNCFDTWNPNLLLSAAYPPPGNYSKDLPPYRPYGVGPDQRAGFSNVDDDGDGHTDFLANGHIDTKELGWPGSDDFLPLTAIQIKISFYDATSKQLREVTLVQSLLYTP